MCVNTYTHMKQRQVSEKPRKVDIVFSIHCLSVNNQYIQDKLGIGQNLLWSYFPTWGEQPVGWLRKKQHCNYFHLGCIQLLLVHKAIILIIMNACMLIMVVKRIVWANYRPFIRSKFFRGLKEETQCNASWIELCSSVWRGRNGLKIALRHTTKMNNN